MKKARMDEIESEISRFLRPLIPVFLTDKSTFENNLQSTSASIYRLFIAAKDERIESLKKLVDDLNNLNNEANLKCYALTQKIEKLRSILDKIIAANAVSINAVIVEVTLAEELLAELQ